MKTLVLLSGGLDSTTVLAAKLQSGDKCVAIGFDYGQKHAIELDRAKHIAKHYEVFFGVTRLPKMFKVDDVVFAGRNLLFAAVAISRAQAYEMDCIAVGCNAGDWERFPDCRAPFWDSLAKCAEAYGIRVDTPLIHLTKREVAELARRLDVPIDLTWSCYSPNGEEPCGECLACKTRNEALQ